MRSGPSPGDCDTTHHLRSGESSLHAPYTSTLVRLITNSFSGFSDSMFEELLSQRHHHTSPAVTGAVQPMLPEDATASRARSDRRLTPGCFPAVAGGLG